MYAHPLFLSAISLPLSSAISTVTGNIRSANSIGVDGSRATLRACRRFEPRRKHLNPKPQLLKYNRAQHQRELILKLPPIHHRDVRLQLRSLRNHIRIQEVGQNSTFRGFHFNRGNSTSTPSSGGHRSASQSRFPEASPATGALATTEPPVRRANSSSVNSTNLFFLRSTNCGPSFSPCPGLR